jgi:cytochrome c6
MKLFKKIATIAWLSLFSIAAIFQVNAVAGTYVINGEAEFKEHCNSCHADGGNIIKADKTLSLKDREKNGIKTSRDIVKLMRKPGEGMTVFDKKTISDKEAKAIANYIIKTFK